MHILVKKNPSPKLSSVIWNVTGFRGTKLKNEEIKSNEISHVYIEETST